MTKDFSKQVADFAEKYKKRLRATARESVQRTVAIAQQTRGEGGRMRVDTGFLRASIGAAIGQMPSGDSEGDGGLYAYTGTAISADLLHWRPDQNQTLYVGWTANYARPREYQDGFMRGATELWSTTVEEVAAEVRRSL